MPASLTSAIASSPSRATIRVALGFAAMIVVAAHRRLRADVREQLGGDPRVLGEDPVGAAQRVGGARATGRRDCRSASRRCAGRAASGSVHRPSINLFQLKRKRVIVQSFIGAWGEGAMIALVGCLGDHLDGASGVDQCADRRISRLPARKRPPRRRAKRSRGDAIEAYLRNACSVQMSSAQKRGRSRSG